MDVWVYSDESGTFDNVHHKTSMVENAIRFNEPVNITTKSGNAVLISEEEYNSLIETVYLSSIKGMKEKLIDGMNTPLSETVAETEVSW